MPQVADQTSGDYRFVAPNYDGTDVPKGTPKRVWTVHDDPAVVAKWQQKYVDWGIAIEAMPPGWRRDRQVAMYEEGRPTSSRTVLICCRVS